MATRQSVTLTDHNDDWLSAQAEGGEYSSKSEVINDLIRQARRHEAISQGLEIAERSVKEYGYSNKTPEQRLEGFKEEARKNGQL